MKSPSGRTWIESESVLYGTYYGPQKRKGRALFPDGKTRRVWGGIPDTVYTIPAHARIAGRYVSGYLSIGDQFDGPEREGEILFRIPKSETP